MINFLEFINKDIDTKKTLITSLPTKTKTNIKKYNSTINSYSKKYAEYKESLKKYLDAKSKSLRPKKSNKNIDSLKENIDNLNKVKFYLNPYNTYYEKLEFDNLIYELSNSYMFNFESLNDVINAFLDKFEMVNIMLTSNDFNYTSYVHEYMECFLEVRYKKTGSYDKVSEVFEKIYWVNPELINHIELNFRRLIRENERKFNSYIKNIQIEVSIRNDVKDYKDCLVKLEDAYTALREASREDVLDIIEHSIQGDFDINQYMENNKVRTAAFELISNIDIKDKEKTDKLLNTLENIKNNIIEYNSYIDFKLLFESFKTEYEPLLNKTRDGKELKNILAKIIAKEKELDKINKKIKEDNRSVTDLNVDRNTKMLRAKSVDKAKELYELYKEHDEAFFKDYILSVLNSNITVSDVLNIYSSYSHFRKLALQKAFNLNEYTEVTEYNELFEEYASNALNVISAGIPVLNESNIAEVIANKYRLNNLIINETDLAEQNLKPLLNKILLIIRVITIENSSIDLEKIWFITKVEKIKD